jgi:selenocysteine-specific elongation factor
MARLTESGAVRIMGRYACLKEFAPSLSRQDEELLSRILSAFKAAAFQPPELATLAAQSGTNAARVAKLVKVACSLGELVQIDASVYLHRSRERELRDTARKLFVTEGPFTVARLREALASSRKFVVPMAEHLDRIGFTRREGDVRIVIERDPS